MDSLHRLKVLGREIQVRNEASPELVREVEEFVNSTVSELQASMRTSDQQLVAILALLNIAETLIVQLRENSRLTHAVSERVAGLLKHIDETVRNS